MPLFDITSSYNNIIITDEDGIVNNTIEKNGITVSVEGVNVVISFSNLSFIQPYTNITVASAVPSSASDAKTLIDALIVYPWSKVSKRLVMSITQTGTDAPTMTILFNELIGAFTWVYSDVGVYLLICTNPVFTLGRTKLSPNLIESVDADHVTFATFDQSGGSAYGFPLNSFLMTSTGAITFYNGLITSQIFEIEVYPV